MTDRRRIALAALSVLAVGLALRLLPAWPQVFRGDEVRLRGNDSQYHLRLAENLAAHPSRGISHDPYLLHPNGQGVAVGPLTDAVVVAVAAAGGAPIPTRRLEGVAAVLPALWGALAAALVCWIGARRCGVLAGTLAGLLLAVIPGQFFERTLLGFADHHAGEVLWSTLALALLLHSPRGAERRFRQVAVAAAAGLALAAYLSTWIMGAVLLAALAGWLWGTMALAALRQPPAPPTAEPPPPPLPVGRLALACALAGLLVLPWFDGVRVLAPSALGAWALAGWAVAFAAAWRIPPAGWRRLAVAAVAVVPLLALLVWTPAVLSQAWDWRVYLSGTEAQARVVEATPLGFRGSWMGALWQEYGVAYLPALAGLGLWLRQAVRRGDSAAGLLAAWGLISLVMTIAQIRFAYYLAVPLALATGEAAGWLLARLGSSSSPAAARRLAVAGLAVALLGPPLLRSTAQARRPLADAAAWNGALDWLRTSTPEPFGDPRHYFAAYPSAGDGGRSAYGVLGWWDDGYRILRRGRRVPLANPTQQGAVEVARFLVSDDPVAAHKLAGEMGARYAILDTSIVASQPQPGRASGRLASIAGWAGEDLFRYLAPLETEDGQVQLYFFPDYFRTTAVRLVAFGGAAVSADAPWVAEVLRPAEAERPARVRLEPMPSYEAARERLAGRDPERFLLVSPEPFLSCVPLEPLHGFRRVYSSPQPAVYRGEEMVPLVQVFERVEAATYSPSAILSRSTR